MAYRLILVFCRSHLRTVYEGVFAYRLLGQTNRKIAGVPFITESRLFHAPFIGGVTPCFDQFFSKVLGSQTLLSPKSEKKWDPPRHPPGGKTTLFSGIRRLHGFCGRYLPRNVFLEGGLYKPL